MRLLPALLLAWLSVTAAQAQAQAQTPPPAQAAPPAAPARAPATAALTDLSRDSGLPVMVRAGLAFVEVEGIDENDQTFTATVDIRLSWLDLRQRYPAEETPVGYREYRGEAVAAQLATMWSPALDLANLRGAPDRESRSLRIYPDGRVELIRRVRGTFASALDVRRFPFDRQALGVDLVAERDTADRVAFDYRQDDLAFSRADPGIELAGWSTGAVTLDRIPLAGWYGESYSRLRASLAVDRHTIETVPALFVPLLASLLIPLLATWLMRAKRGEFEIETFELTNLIIGGLFAVIALNFTIYSERSILASGVNTVSLLFGLNYLALAVALVINVALYRFGAVRAVAGRHVQQETFRFILWALPVAVAGTALALILIAAA